MSDQVIVAMSGITKRFGGVHALCGVDLTLRAGEVHALLGENGAGKSTLINILSGVVTDYDGEISIGGRPARFAGPAAAQAAGIATIHQELDLVPALSVAENLVLGREPRTRLRTLDRRAMTRAARDWLGPLGAQIDPRRPVGSLRVGEQQLVEIAKALSLDARVLVMDEPTAALADAEVRRLMSTIRALRERGVAVVYISHRLEEIEHIADRATVLRNGEVAGTLRPDRADRQRIITLMVGRPAEALFSAGSAGPARPAGPPVLEVDDLAVRPRGTRPGRCEPAGVSLTVRAGEIVGLAGLMGAGRTELLETLYGAGPPGRRSGLVRLAGRPYAPRGPRAALRAGVGFVPEDRRRSALVLEHPVGRSIVLAALRRLSTAGVVRAGRERDAVRQQVAALAIKTSSAAAPVGSLSGGNQQKVVFARHLLTRPRLLLLDEPTRGVDVGAKAEIYRLLRRLADDGMGILLASSELPELTGVCDRIVVLRRGRAVAELAADGCTGEDILTAAMGGTAAGRDDR
ncbi:sugar ABC transporter ATP-binding protein [Micromonospora sp. DSM 115977]|uniref:Sugar ABC transporter ATP-binding protein n=1 Tax=Micromonospora reichwaldensis TaxID=3075516 RepID=A0ABU2WY20_9ACTN|nr:sugar ABC transporter ATP-binding protein [Micromonospora sp. DSM 115977]MDT0530833.1 sugar ABC transporter ATP-binding protein [Micromonospora sp. DSM 115977]